MLTCEGLRACTNDYRYMKYIIREVIRELNDYLQSQESRHEKGIREIRIQNRHTYKNKSCVKSQEQSDRRLHYL